MVWYVLCKILKQKQSTDQVSEVFRDDSLQRILPFLCFSFVRSKYQQLRHMLSTYISKLCKCDFVFQSKSLIGDQSIVFSPPSIIKETLCDEKSFSFNDAFTFPKSPNISAVKVSLFNTFLERQPSYFKPRCWQTV